MLAKEKNAKPVVILDVQIKSGCSSFKKKKCSNATNEVDRKGLALS